MVRRTWLGLTVRYRLPRRQRIEGGPSIDVDLDLLLGELLRFDHLLFTFSLRGALEVYAPSRPETGMDFLANQVPGGHRPFLVGFHTYA